MRVEGAATFPGTMWCRLRLCRLRNVQQYALGAPMGDEPARLKATCWHALVVSRETLATFMSPHTPYVGRLARGWRFAKYRHSESYGVKGLRVYGDTDTMNFSLKPSSCGHRVSLPIQGLLTVLELTVRQIPGAGWFRSCPRRHPAAWRRRALRRPTGEYRQSQAVHRLATV